MGMAEWIAFALMGTFDLALVVVLSIVAPTERARHRRREEKYY